MSSGFVAFRSRIDAISAAFGGGKFVRAAISEEFKSVLKRRQQGRLVVGDYSTPDWTEALEEDFDASTLRAEAIFKSVPIDPVLATAPWQGCDIELRAMRADLVGGEYRAVLALISDMSVYDTRERGNVTKWSPFLTDTAICLITGSRYSGSGSPKSVSVRSESAASASLRKLVERHFQVSFTNLSNPD